jgi:hypothetical protein
MEARKSGVEIPEHKVSGEEIRKHLITKEGLLIEKSSDIEFDGKLVEFKDNKQDLKYFHIKENQSTEISAFYPGLLNSIKIQLQKGKVFFENQYSKKE